MHHDRRTQTCFIGEYASLHTPGDSQFDTVTGDTAADRFHGESTAHDGSKNRTHLINVHDQNDQGADNIGNRHKGHQLLCDRCNSLDAADDDQGRQDHKNDTCHVAGNAEDLVEVGADRIDLAHIADTERGNCTENTEKHCQDGTDLLTSRF